MATAKKKTTPKTTKVVNEKTQKELDEKKYFQSQTARQDLSGLMEYCDNCDFRLFSQEKQRLICNLDSKSREENKVCEKNYRRRKQK